ncbi:hypothetical protein ACHAQH_002832 [Verticillium albo-atrum]
MLPFRLIPNHQGLSLSPQSPREGTNAGRTPDNNKATNNKTKTKSRKHMVDNIIAASFWQPTPSDLDDVDEMANKKHGLPNVDPRTGEA